MMNVVTCPMQKYSLNEFKAKTKGQCYNIKRCTVFFLKKKLCMKNMNNSEGFKQLSNIHLGVTKPT